MSKELLVASKAALNFYAGKPLSTKISLAPSKNLNITSGASDLITLNGKISPCFHDKMTGMKWCTSPNAASHAHVC